MLEVNWVEIYLSAFVIAAIGFVLGFAVSRNRYKDRYTEDLKAFKVIIDTKTEENERLKAERSRDISHAITKEWNRGYNAAFEQLKNEFHYIHQWEKEHGISSSELEILTDEFVSKENKEEQ